MQHLVTYTRLDNRSITWKKVSRAFLSLQPIGNWTQDELMARMRKFITSNKLTGDEESLRHFVGEEPLVIAIPADEESVHAVWIGSLSKARQTFTGFDHTKSIDGEPEPDNDWRL